MSSELNALYINVIDLFKNDGVYCDYYSKYYDEIETDNNPSLERGLFKSYNDRINLYNEVLKYFKGEVHSSINETIPVIDFNQLEYTSILYKYPYTDTGVIDSSNIENVNTEISEITEMNTVNADNELSLVNRAVMFQEPAKYFYNTNTGIPSKRYLCVSPYKENNYKFKYNATYFEEESVSGGKYSYRIYDKSVENYEENELIVPIFYGKTTSNSYITFNLNTRTNVELYKYSSETSQYSDAERLNYNTLSSTDVFGNGAFPKSLGENEALKLNFSVNKNLALAGSSQFTYVNASLGIGSYIIVIPSNINIQYTRIIVVSPSSQQDDLNNKKEESSLDTSLETYDDSDIYVFRADSEYFTNIALEEVSPDEYMDIKDRPNLVNFIKKYLDIKMIHYSENSGLLNGMYSYPLEYTDDEKQTVKTWAFINNDSDGQVNDGYQYFNGAIVGRGNYIYSPLQLTKKDYQDVEETGYVSILSKVRQNEEYENLEYNGKLSLYYDYASLNIGNKVNTYLFDNKEDWIKVNQYEKRIITYKTEVVVEGGEYTAANDLEKTFLALITTHTGSARDEAIQMYKELFGKDYITPENVYTKEVVDQDYTVILDKNITIRSLVGIDDLFDTSKLSTSDIVYLDNKLGSENIDLSSKSISYGNKASFVPSNIEYISKGEISSYIEDMISFYSNMTSIAPGFIMRNVLTLDLSKDNEDNILYCITNAIAVGGDIPNDPDHSFTFNNVLYREVINDEYAQSACSNSNIRITSKSTIQDLASSPSTCFIKVSYVRTYRQEEGNTSAGKKNKDTLIDAKINTGINVLYNVNIDILTPFDIFKEINTDYEQYDTILIYGNYNHYFSEESILISKTDLGLKSEEDDVKGSIFTLASPENNGEMITFKCTKVLSICPSIIDTVIINDNLNAIYSNINAAGVAQLYETDGNATFTQILGKFTINSTDCYIYVLEPFSLSLDTSDLTFYDYRDIPFIVDSGILVRPVSYPKEYFSNTTIYSSNGNLYQLNHYSDYDSLLNMNGIIGLPPRNEYDTSSLDKYYNVLESFYNDRLPSIEYELLNKIFTGSFLKNFPITDSDDNYLELSDIPSLVIALNHTLSLLEKMIDEKIQYESSTGELVYVTYSDIYYLSKILNNVEDTIYNFEAYLSGYSSEDDTKVDFSEIKSISDLYNKIKFNISHETTDTDFSTGKNLNELSSSITSILEEEFENIKDKLDSIKYHYQIIDKCLGNSMGPLLKTEDLVYNEIPESLKGDSVKQISILEPIYSDEVLSDYEEKTHFVSNSIYLLFRCLTLLYEYYYNANKSIFTVSDEKEFRLLKGNLTSALTSFYAKVEGSSVIFNSDTVQFDYIYGLSSQKDRVTMLPVYFRGVYENGSIYKLYNNESIVSDTLTIFDESGNEITLINEFNSTDIYGCKYYFIEEGEFLKYKDLNSNEKLINVSLKIESNTYKYYITGYYDKEKNPIENLYYIGSNKFNIITDKNYSVIKDYTYYNYSLSDTYRDATILPQFDSDSNEIFTFKLSRKHDERQTLSDDESVSFDITNETLLGNSQIIITQDDYYIPVIRLCIPSIVYNEDKTFTVTPLTIDGKYSYVDIELTYLNHTYFSEEDGILYAIETTKDFLPMDTFTSILDYSEKSLTGKNNSAESTLEYPSNDDSLSYTVSNDIDESDGLYYKRYITLNSRMNIYNGPLYQASNILRNMKILEDSNKMNVDLIKLYANKMITIPINAIGDTYWLPAQEMTVSTAKIEGKLYDKKIMDEMSSIINDRCVLTCKSCSIKEGCPFYNENEVIKMYVPEIEYLHFTLKDNKLDLISPNDFNLKSGSSSKSYEDYHKYHNMWASIDDYNINNTKVHKDYRIIEEEEIRLRSNLKSDYVNYYDMENPNGLGWLTKARYGTIVDNSYMKETPNSEYDMSKVYNYQYLYNALFIPDEETYFDYVESKEKYNVSVTLKDSLDGNEEEKTYTGNVRLMMPNGLRFNNSNANFEYGKDYDDNDDVYLVSDDEEDDSGNKIFCVIYLNKLGVLNKNLVFDVMEGCFDPNTEVNSENDSTIYPKDVAQWSVNILKGDCANDPVGNIEKDQNYGYDQYWMPFLRKKVFNKSSGEYEYISIDGRKRETSTLTGEILCNPNNINEYATISGKPVIGTYINFLRNVDLNVSCIQWVKKSTYTQIGTILGKSFNYEQSIEQQKSTLPYMKTNLRFVLVKNG